MKTFEKMTVPKKENVLDIIESLIFENKCRIVISHNLTEKLTELGCRISTHSMGYSSPQEDGYIKKYRIGEYLVVLDMKNSFWSIVEGFYKQDNDWNSEHYISKESDLIYLLV